MERDIVRGRAAMNLSAWASYSAAQQQTLAAKMVQEARENAMPLPQYRMIHWGSRVTDADKAMLAGWARATWGLDPSAGGEAGAAGDPVHGKELFEKRCTGCHALTANREGPQLAGVYGRTSGTAAGFAYSVALKKAQIVWDDETLERWLTDPDAFIPGNNMDFLVTRVQERRDIIEYLRQVSGK
jgi:cytochrome c